MAIAKNSGFILDVPKVLIKTSTGIASMVTGDSGSVAFGGDSISINGGWGFYQLTEIDKSKTIDIKISNAVWDMDLMALGTGASRTQGAGQFEYFGDPYIIDAAAYTITIPYVALAGTVRVNGYTETASATPTTGQFKVTIAATTTTLLFPVADANAKVYPSFKVATTASDMLTVKTTDFPSSGEITLTFPIYGGQDSNSAAVVAYGQFLIYKAKILQTQTYGGSYKTASKFDMEFKGLDANRAGNEMFKFTYNPA